MTPQQDTEVLKTPRTEENRITISGSEAVLEAFIAEGVETIFGYPGGAIMPIYDALYDYSEKLNIFWFAMNRVVFMLHRVMHEHPEKRVLCLQPVDRVLQILLPVLQMQ